RLAELDDLGVLDRPVARKALRWLADRQRPDGTWEEDEALAAVAPPWARPGDPEARLYLTASAGFWLGVSSEQPLPGEPDPNRYAEAVRWATEAFRASMREDGSWPSYLVAGWLGAALLYRANMFYEAAQIQVILVERIPDMTPADVAWLAAALRRAGMSIE